MHTGQLPPLITGMGCCACQYPVVKLVTEIPCERDTKSQKRDQRQFEISGRKMDQHGGLNVRSKRGCNWASSSPHASRCKVRRLTKLLLPLLKLPWNFPETSLELPWNFPETPLKLPRNSPETSAKLLSTVWTPRQSLVTAWGTKLWRQWCNESSGLLWAPKYSHPKVPTNSPKVIWKYANMVRIGVHSVANSRSVRPTCCCKVRSLTKLLLPLLQTPLKLPWNCRKTAGIMADTAKVRKKKWKSKRGKVARQAWSGGGFARVRAAPERPPGHNSPSVPPASQGYCAVKGSLAPVTCQLPDRMRTNYATDWR